MAAEPRTTTQPTVEASDERIPRLYESAIATIRRNVRIGRHGTEILCAGGDYPSPWTRDAAINSWSAVSLLDPALAEATLREVTAPGEGGDVVQQDDQLWDQLVWAIGARRHVEITDDRDFARWAAGVVERTLTLRHDAYLPELGLFAGGALMQDGISGYPFPETDSADDSSFIGDYAQAHTIASLSTNLVYAAAFDAQEWLREQTRGGSGGSCSTLGGELRSAIRRAFRDQVTGDWSYLVGENGDRLGFQELLGLALLLEHGDLADAEAAALAGGIRRCAAGIPLVYPHFPRYDEDHAGRHNMMIWPMATGQWAVAAARRGAHRAFAESFGDLVRVVTASGGSFFEVYDARDGSVDGGWQVGTRWTSVPDQTWSATAYLRCVHEGLIGMRAGIDALCFEPVLPSGLDRIGLTSLPWRGDVLDIEISGSGRGSGSRLSHATVDGVAWDARSGPVTVTPNGGRREIRIELARDTAA
jgi:hypothetical protein